MKKALALIAALCLLTLTLSACSGQSPAPDSRQSANTQASDAPQTPPAATRRYFGKIKQVVGNEVTLDLAASPLEEESPEDAPADEGAPDGAVTVVAMTIAIPASSADVPVEDHMALDYLDEAKAFTIPAGTPIRDMSSGQEVQLSSLKKGAVLMIVTQEDTGAVLEIEIWEQA